MSNYEELKKIIAKVRTDYVTVRSNFTSCFECKKKINIQPCTLTVGVHTISLLPRLRYIAEDYRSTFGCQPRVTRIDRGYLSSDGTCSITINFLNNVIEGRSPRFPLPVTCGRKGCCLKALNNFKLFNFAGGGTVLDYPCDGRVAFHPSEVLKINGETVFRPRRFDSIHQIEDITVGVWAAKMRLMLKSMNQQ